MEWGCGRVYFAPPGDTAVSRWMRCAFTHSWPAAEEVSGSARQELGINAVLPVHERGHFRLHEPGGRLAAQEKLAGYYRQSSLRRCVPREKRANPYRVSARCSFGARTISRRRLATECAILRADDGRPAASGSQIRGRRATRFGCSGRNPWGFSMFTDTQRGGAFSDATTCTYSAIAAVEAAWFVGGLVDSCCRRHARSSAASEGCSIHRAAILLRRFRMSGPVYPRRHPRLFDERTRRWTGRRRRFCCGPRWRSDRAAAATTRRRPEPSRRDRLPRLGKKSAHGIGFQLVASLGQTSAIVVHVRADLQCRSSSQASGVATEAAARARVE